MFPSDYLASWDIEKNTPVVIKEVVAGKVGKEKEDCWLMYFDGAAKALVLNKTNARIIAGLHGVEMGDWAGKKVTLFVDQCDAFGKTVDCIRVKK